MTSQLDATAAAAAAVRRCRPARGLARPSRCSSIRPPLVRRRPAAGQRGMMRHNRAVNIHPEAQAATRPDRLLERGPPIGRNHHQQKPAAAGPAQLAADSALPLAKLVKIVDLRRRDLSGKALLDLPRLAEQGADLGRSLVPLLAVFEDFLTGLDELKHLA